MFFQKKREFSYFSVNEFITGLAVIKKQNTKFNILRKS
jgi:hypothetical protein